MIIRFLQSQPASPCLRASYPCQLLEENNRAHFMTKRFYRADIDGLPALAHRYLLHRRTNDLPAHQTTVRRQAKACVPFQIFRVEFLFSASAFAIVVVRVMAMIVLGMSTALFASDKSTIRFNPC